MLIVNKMLYQSCNLYNYIEASINRLVNNNLDLTVSKEYWLFYFIKDDFRANFSSLYGTNIDLDFLGFPVIQKNTRHAIESFLDLFNLCNDQDYMEVLKHCAHEQKSTGKYSAYLYKEQFSIQSKCKIAKEKYGADFQFLVDLSKKSNAYIHPNVFVDVISVSEKDKKESILKELLSTNTYLFDYAYRLILKRFNQDLHPYLGCCTKTQCIQCYRTEYEKILTYIDTQLLIEIPQSPYTFQH